MGGELEKEWEQRICSIEWKLFAFLSIFFPIESNGEFGLCAFHPIDINAIFYFSSHNWHVHDTSSYVQCSFYYQMSKHCNSNRHNALRYIFFDFCWIAVIRRVKRKKERTWLKQKWYDEKYQSYIKQTHTLAHTAHVLKKQDPDPRQTEHSVQDSQHEYAIYKYVEHYILWACIKYVK